ncbi:phospholipid/cholesterol/gamma-HCH transport system substrate-binding protein [Micromonospora pattaloongensis]|uniref:Phospholipid/cholesterol/gamma-HCH transport system substrate-binding protein n=1 Tax=Micromonospora pattaloongensis TaxID=405436 RepID=A0A1H3RWA9_9ACTN|nr:MCE family protein [Micromonospora pattaloongensis]SDZ29139.1 phospholipid/cholesterol/gamma-HCH transport system substrate-binding protein [Micromonospora pattaloongensis]
MSPRLRRALGGALAVAVLATGCDVPTLTDVPLPGGAPSGPGYRVTIEFADVLDLVPQAAVKVDDVTVGSVEEISLSGWTARARVRIDRAVRLPANATAAVRQSSLLGEKYVAVAAPVTEDAHGGLGDGAVIPLSRTRRSAEVEEVLAALGLLLNGGGLAQLKTINEELVAALDGREAAARDALRQLDAFIGGLERQKADLVRAVEALDRLSGRLARQQQVIGDAVDALAPGVTVLAEQRAQLTGALTALGELGRVGTRVVTETRKDTVASVRALQPILEQLVRAGDDLPKSMDFMLSYPFPPNVTGAIVGDFMNLSVTADLDAASILANLVAAAPAPARSAAARPAAPTRPPGPALPHPGGLVPGLPELLPPKCLPKPDAFPPTFTPPKDCLLPPGCVLLRPGSPVPPGGLLPPKGVVPPGTFLPPDTELPPGTVLSPECLPAPPTGAVTGQIGTLPDVLRGGLRP